MKKTATQDPFSTNVEGSPAEEMSESHAQEAKEAPSEHELDAHHETLMKAEGIKADKHIMKHLGPHMAKKAGHMKSAMAAVGMHPPAGKITSIEGIKAAGKKLGA